LVRAGFTVRQRPVRPEVGAARLAWETLVGRSGAVGMPS